MKTHISTHKDENTSSWGISLSQHHTLHEPICTEFNLTIHGIFYKDSPYQNAQDNAKQAKRIFSRF